jgi:multiple sugar transport system permease protein
MTTVSTRRRRAITPLILLYAVLVALAIVIISPLVWAVFTSFKTPFDTIHNPGSLLPQPFTWENYAIIFSNQQPVLRWFFNSVAAAVLHTAIVLVTSAAAAYALARLEFRGKKVVFGAIVATILVPPVIFLIPNYLIVQNLGWLDTIWAIAVPSAAGAFGVFFLRQFFVSLPAEVEEAARVDGAGDFRIFFQMVLPLAKPALATLAVLTFLTNWNDFLWPVYVLLSPENLTLQPGLATLAGAYGPRYGVVMAGAVIAAIPVLIIFVFAQRQIVESVGATGIKG